MPSNGGGVRPQHRSSGSRVVPAIPYALSSNRRQSQANVPATPTTNTDSNSGQAESNSEARSTNALHINAQTKNASSSPSTIANGVETSVAPIKDEPPSQSSPEQLMPGTELTDAPTVSKNIEHQPITTAPPSAFNPVAESDPSSATSASFLANASMQMPPPFHHPRGNTGGFTFGAFRESPSTPPNPHVNGAQMINPPPGPYHPGPQPTAAPFIPNGHAYHSSDPIGAPPFGPGYDPQPMAHQYPRDFGYNHHPNQFQPRAFHPGPGRVPMNSKHGNETGFHGPPMGPPNGPLPPSTPVMSKASEPKAIHPELVQGRHPGQLPSNQTNMPNILGQPNAEHFGSRSNSIDADAAIDLGLYLHSQFGNYDSADYIVRYSHSANLFAPADIPCHAMILVKSPKLSSLMTMQDRRGTFQGRKELNAVISDKFVTDGDAFGKALHRLYAEPLPDLKSFDSNQTAMPERMDFALAFAAAGHFLQYDEIVSHGLEMARRSLSWATVRNALAFALDGGLSPSWMQRDSSEDRDSASSFDGTPSKLASPASAPTYGIYNDRLLESIVQFMIENCPVNLTYSPGMPAQRESQVFSKESRNSRSNSRLSHIRFGQMTIDEVPALATSEGACFSDVLLSLPFPVLKHLLEHPSLTSKLGASKLVEIMRAVVDDRERHRKVKVKNHKESVQSTFDEAAMRESHWSEAVEPNQQHSSGFKLVRHRLGTETPTSTTSAKD
ncbi:MAG: hypothetical protein M1831_006348 [Alyxoria varia]|nr:MAG: hypothetical protein M1831_006348 [Alyxoria varia]